MLLDREPKSGGSSSGTEVTHCYANCSSFRPWFHPEKWGAWSQQRGVCVCGGHREPAAWGSNKGAREEHDLINAKARVVAGAQQDSAFPSHLLARQPGWLLPLHWVSSLAPGLCVGLAGRSPVFSVSSSLDWLKCFKWEEYQRSGDPQLPAWSCVSSGASFPFLGLFPPL